MLLSFSPLNYATITSADTRYLSACLRSSILRNISSGLDDHNSDHDYLR